MNNTKNNKHVISIENELKTRIEMNFRRLCDPIYQIDQVFSPPEYRSYGDKEGRALFAFMCHVHMTGKETPCLHEMLEILETKTNEKGFFGPIYNGLIDEFQYGGHNWYLRALCDAAKHYRNDRYLELAKKAFEGLFYPALGHFRSYPVERPFFEGDMLGNEMRMNEWILCSDVGAAFMSIDGLTDYYIAAGDERAHDLIDEMTEVFLKIDKIQLQTQTHATLTAARGMLKLYEYSGDEKYFNAALDIWELYIEKGMTATFANFNWFGRGETWTEPCTIVDSLILALHFYRLKGLARDLTLARRIWHNALASAQRPNGGAGIDTCVTPNLQVLKVESIYEAFFCCSMRLAEGLLWAKENAYLLEITVEDVPVRDSIGRYMSGDLIYGEPAGCALQGAQIRVDGHILTPLVKYYLLDSDETAKKVEQRILFINQ